MDEHGDRDDPPDDEEYGKKADKKADHANDTADDTADGKARWRARLLADRRRGSHVPVDGAAHARVLGPFLARSVPADRRVVGYDALGGEVDLGPLVAAHPSPGGRYALTRTPATGRELTVHPWDAPRERHRFGYDQPVADAPTVALGEIGAVLVPGLAFDRAGARLGWGAGWYDRFLARLDPGVLRIGIVVGAPVGGLPTEAHDVAMTHLATAVEVWAVGPASLSGG